MVVLGGLMRSETKGEWGRPADLYRREARRERQDLGSISDGKAEWGDWCVHSMQAILHMLKR